MFPSKEELVKYWWIKFDRQDIDPKERDKAYPLFRDRVRKFIAKNNLILDLGCGGGNFLINLHKDYGIDCVGVDISLSGIKAAHRRNVNEIDGKLSFIVADGENLPFKDNLFDVVVCIDVLEHLTYPNKVLSQIGMVLRANGIVIIESPHRKSPLTVFSYTSRQIKVPTVHELLAFFMKAIRFLARPEGERVIPLLNFTYGDHDLTYALHIKEILEILSANRLKCIYKTTIVESTMLMPSRLVKIFQKLPLLWAFGPSLFVVARKSG